MTGKLLDAFLADMDSLDVSVGSESPETTSTQMPSPVKAASSIPAAIVDKKPPLDESKTPTKPQVHAESKTMRPRLRRRASLHVEIGAASPKIGGIKRSRSTSESGTPKGIETIDVLATILNVNVGGNKFRPRNDYPDDAFDHRWAKVPKLDVRSPWMSGCGLMPGDEVGMITLATFYFIWYPLLTILFHNDSESRCHCFSTEDCRLTPSLMRSSLQV